MTTLNRHQYVQDFQKLLGDGFEYYFNIDILHNQIGKESDKRLVSFKYKPPKNIATKNWKKLFNDKLSLLETQYEQFDIFGGQYPYEGYMIHIELKTKEDIIEAINLETINHEKNMQKLQKQLEILSKKENNKIKIFATLETSDHDGYCSGNECEYKCEEVEHIIDLSGQLHMLNNIDECKDDFDKYLPCPELGDGSGYCFLDEKCVNSGLGKHDYKYTIRKIEVVDEK
jgi:hypothetical protein